MSEEQEMINATLGNGKRLKQILIQFLYIKLLVKVTNMLNSDQYPNQGLFRACSSIKEGESGIC